MARQRLCKVCSKWHDLDEAWPSRCWPTHQDKRSSLSSPMIIADSMDPVQSMADGKTYTSKAALRATYHPSGNADGKRYVEVGNDMPMKLKPKERPKRADIKASVARAFSKVGLGA